jgi:hypothetical protein
LTTSSSLPLNQTQLINVYIHTVLVQLIISPPTSDRHPDSEVALALDLDLALALAPGPDLALDRPSTSSLAHPCYPPYDLDPELELDPELDLAPDPDLAHAPDLAASATQAAADHTPNIPRRKCYLVSNSSEAAHSRAGIVYLANHIEIVLVVAVELDAVAVGIAVMDVLAAAAAGAALSGHSTMAQVAADVAADAAEADIATEEVLVATDAAVAAPAAVAAAAASAQIPPAHP